MHWKFLKIFFSRTSWPNSIKLGTHYPWVKGIQVCSNKGPVPLQRGDNYKNVKMGWGHKRIFLLKNCWPRKTEIYMKAFWHSTKSSLLKSWSPRGSGGATIGETVFTNFYKRNFFKFSV
jgi:hypothetical protein